MHMMRCYSLNCKILYACLARALEYEVETILNSKGMHKRSGYFADRLEYLSSDRDWELTENLTNARQCICTWLNILKKWMFINFIELMNKSMDN